MALLDLVKARQRRAEFNNSRLDLVLRREF
jgi:hypothetical protein